MFNRFGFEKDKDKDKNTLVVPKVPFVEYISDEEENGQDYKEDYREDYRLEGDDSRDYSRDYYRDDYRKKSVKKKKITYIDLYSYLFREGYMYLYSDLTEDRATIIMGLLLYIALREGEEDAPKNPSLLLSCSSGCAKSALGIFDILEGIPTEIKTIGVGPLGGAGTCILLGGKPRLAYSHARISLALFQYLDSSQQKLCLRNALEELHTRNTLMGIFAEKTGQPIEIIKEDMKNLKIMSAEEAQNYGLIDDRVSDLFLKDEREDEND